MRVCVVIIVNNNNTYVLLFIEYVLLFIVRIQRCNSLQLNIRKFIMIATKLQLLKFIMKLLKFIIKSYWLPGMRSFPKFT